MSARALKSQLHSVSRSTPITSTIHIVIEKINREARIQKFVVTEMQTIEVPVTREEVRIVREPISEEDRVKYEGASLGDQEASVVLYEERVVVSKVTVPVERVSLRTETVEETKVVEETVARERLETEGPVTGGVESGQVRDGDAGLGLSGLDLS